MKLKNTLLLFTIGLVTLLSGCNYEENTSTDISSAKNAVKFYKIYDGYLTSESNEDRPEEVVYCFNDTLKWEEFRTKYLKGLDIPRIDPDSHNKTLLCLFTLQAIPYKLSQVDIQELITMEAKIIFCWTLRE